MQTPARRSQRCYRTLKNNLISTYAITHDIHMKHPIIERKTISRKGKGILCRIFCCACTILAYSIFGELHIIRVITITHAPVDLIEPSCMSELPSLQPLGATWGSPNPGCRQSMATGIIHDRRITVRKQRNALFVNARADSNLWDSCWLHWIMFVYWMSVCA